MGYREIEDIKRIRKLGKDLDSTLRENELHTESRTIGVPGGNAIREVFFLEDNGDDSLWYVHFLAANGDRMITVFGHGKYRDTNWLSIDVQFNHPVDRFHRRCGAAFLEDPITGDVFLAHRGILTLRHRVPKDRILEAMAADVVEVETLRRTDKYILVTPLNSKTLVEDLSNFSRRLRRTVRGLGDDGASVTVVKPTKGTDGLRDYFKEFSGKLRAFTPKKIFPVAYHGEVVHALNDEMARRGRTFKSLTIDLAVELNKIAISFEGKTKADTQSVYTGIGQLTVHAPTVNRFLEKSVQKVLVVPEYPMSILNSIIKDDLDIQIVTYSISASGKVAFSGLEKI